AVVIALHLVLVAAIPIILEGAQLDDVLVERQGGGGGVPDEAVHPVAQHGDIGQIIGDDPCAALRPVQVDVVAVREIRAQGNPQQAALGGEVDRQVGDLARAEVEGRRVDYAVDHVVHEAGGSLEHEEVIVPQEGHGRGLGQAADNRSHS